MWAGQDHIVSCLRCFSSSRIDGVSLAEKKSQKIVEEKVFVGLVSPVALEVHVVCV